MFIVTVLLLLVGFAYATNATGNGTIQQFTVQSMNGIVFKNTGGFTLSQFFFDPITGTGPATTSCQWAAGLCSSAVTLGDWSILVNIQLNAGAIPATGTATYTLCVNLNCLNFTVPSTATAGSISSFQMDLGTATLLNTFALFVMIQ